MIEIRSYVSRWEFILGRCANKTVLHLGCIGITEGTTDDKVHAMINGRVLHAAIRKHARRVVGIDYDLSTVQALQHLGFTEILYGDVMCLDKLQIVETFDVIVCGDLIEHLDNPGIMLNGIKRFMRSESELIITTPNSFGLLAFLRYLFGRYREGNDHLLSFNIYTLENILKRYGFWITEAYSCYNRPPVSTLEYIKYALGIPVLKIIPKLGGTLCVIAKVHDENPMV